MPILTIFFSGWGWPWVGEFVGFIILFICLPTQQNLVNRKHRMHMLPGSDMYCTDPAQDIMKAGQDPDDLLVDRDLYPFVKYEM